MNAGRLPLIIAALFVVVVVAAYFVSETLPIFLIAVLGLPVAAFALNRANPPRDDS